MKKLVTLTTAAILAVINSTVAADVTGVPASKSSASAKESSNSRFGVSSYVTVRTGEAPFSGDYDGGVGLEASLNLSKTLSVCAHGVVENDTRGVFIDEAGASLKVSPFNIQSFTPYGRVGYAYSFNSLNHFGVLGVGASVDAFKSIKLFSDVNWYTDMENLKHNGHALVRIGGGISF